MDATISVKELREQFPKIRQELEEGKSFILIYHSKPLAEIFPFSKKKKGDAISWLKNPPKSAFFKKYPLSAVEIIRKERGNL